MKLVRLAVIQLASSADDWHGSTYNLDGVPVQVLRAQQRDKDYFLLLAAYVPLEGEPEINTDGYILVPEPQRKQAEAAIEAFANLVAVSTRSSRRITSPVPYLALIPEDHEAHERLNRTKGLLLSTGGVAFSPFHISDNDCLQHLTDRSDGVALLAEALTQDHAVGHARELYRFFERAFACNEKELGKSLKEFLKGTAHNFSATEINRWIKFRGRTIHADRSDEFFLERDFRLISQRMEEAAYDILFNKEEWRSRTATRRIAFPIPIGTSSYNCRDMFKRPSAEEPITYQFLDAFSSYVINLEMGLKNLPTDWYHESSDRWELRTETAMHRQAI
jgi:hypothetical protein